MGTLCTHTIKKEDKELSVYSGDFLGFQLGDIHSERLNITRVSSGDRYNDGLIPNFQDTIIQVPGGDGTYYFNSFYTQKTFTIDFAFDDLRDEDLRALRQLFSFKGLQPLIFDEFPYKKYMVKCAQPPQLKYIPFDYLEFRVYKGEGSVQLVAYYPYAFSVVDILVDPSNGIISNNGDLPANLEIIYSAEDLQNGVLIQLQDESNNILGSMTIDSFTKYAGDYYVLFNMKTYLLEGMDASYNKTGTLYNKYISAGDFFFPPVGKSILTSNDLNYVKAQYTPLFY